MLILDSHCHVFSRNNVTQLNNSGHPLDNDHTLDVLINSIQPITNHQIEGCVLVEAVEFFATLNDPNLKELALAEYLTWIRMLKGTQLPLEGTSKIGENYIKGLVPWVPVPKGPKAVDEMLQIYKNHSSPQEYCKIKGVRFLFQNQPKGTCTSQKVADSINYIASQGLVFDVGIDMNEGLWQFKELSN